MLSSHREEMNYNNGCYKYKCDIFIGIYVKA